MTALDRYIRLEATGRWRERKGTPWREVLVSFGNASLVLSDFTEAPLTHWSLAAVGVVEAGDNRALYVPGAGADEMLEISDAAMIEAIAAVSAMVRRKRAQPHRTGPRRVLVGGLAVAALVGVGVWGPDFLRARAFALIPPERAVLVGAKIETRLAAPPCRLPSGQRALARMARALDLDATRFSVRTGTAPLLTRLPGGTVLVASTLPETAQSPEALAGWLLLGAALPRSETVMADWARTRSPFAALGFLLSGRIAPADIDWMAARVPGRTFVPTPEAVETARARLATAGLPEGPFLADLAARFPAVTLLRPRAADRAAAPLLGDQSWVALQEICAR